MKTDLYKCPLSKDNLCRHGGFKTFSPGALLEFCYKEKKFIRDLKGCPKEIAVSNTVIKIITQHLEQDNFDGLFHPNDCACLISDLAPCDSNFSECKPGYRISCTCGAGCDFHISEKRR